MTRIGVTLLTQARPLVYCASRSRSGSTPIVWHVCRVNEAHTLPVGCAVVGAAVFGRAGGLVALVGVQVARARRGSTGAGGRGEAPLRAVPCHRAVGAACRPRRCLCHLDVAVVDGSAQVDARARRRRLYRRQRRRRRGRRRGRRGRRGRREWEPAGNCALVCLRVEGCRDVVLEPPLVPVRSFIHSFNECKIPVRFVVNVCLAALAWPHLLRARIGREGSEANNKQDNINTHSCELLHDVY